MEPETITYTEINMTPSFDNKEISNMNDKIEFIERRFKSVANVIGEMKDTINNAFLLCEKTQENTKIDIKSINIRINKTDILISDVDSIKKTIKQLEDNILMMTDFMKNFVDD